MKEKIIDWLYTRRRACEVLIGVILLAAIFVLARGSFFYPLEHLLLDAHFHLKPLKQASPEIVLVAVDEASLDVFGRWPWSRDKHAALVGVLKHPSFQPAALGYDLLFENADRENTQADQHFVQQVSSFQNPAVMAYFFEKGSGAEVELDTPKEEYLHAFALQNVEWVPPKIEKAHRSSLPFLELSAASKLAFVNTPIDPDGRTRRAQLLIEYKERIYPSMDVLLAMYYLKTPIENVRLAKGRIIFENSSRGRMEIPVDEHGEMLINYDSRPSTVPVYSFMDILEQAKLWMQGTGNPDFLKGFKDKIVIVGVSALGLGDRRVTPLHQYETGINLHAQAVQNIVTGKFLTELPHWGNMAALVLIGLAVILLTRGLRISLSLPAAVLLYLVFFAAAHMFFVYGVWIHTAAHLVAVVLIFIAMTSFRYFLALEDLKRTQEQLIQSSKMAALGQMSAGLGHEFRNILTAINLNIEYCTRVSHDPEKLNKGLQRIVPVLKSANLILTSLMTFSRKNGSEKKSTDLKSLMEEVLLLADQELSRHGIDLEATLEPVPYVRCDSGQISQVLINMLNNSRDALQKQEKKKVSVRLYSTSGKVCFEIEDNGEGIPEEIRRNLFQPFVTSKPRGQGTGLGLSVCYGIIKNHQGTIDVQSTPGRGTRWTIVLPAETAAEITEAEEDGGADG